MALIKTIRGITPMFGKDCFLAENSTIVGEVVMGDHCSVWFQAVVRGDVNLIKVGDRVNIQDGAVIHATFNLSTTNIGNDVSIGHNALVHGCRVMDNVLIGMGAVVMDHVIVESNSIIAAGAVVLENTIVESGTIYAGIPAKKVKLVDAEEIRAQNQRIAENYILYSSWYKV